MSSVAPSEGFTALSPASVGGRRGSRKKMKLVKKKTVRRMLKKMGLKMRGGAAVEGQGAVAMDAKAADVVKQAATGAPAGGRRRSHRRKGKSLFGMRF
jgi:hypothetical protein